MPNTKPHPYTPVPYEANREKRLAWQTAYRGKEKQRVADRKGYAERLRLLSPCQCSTVGTPCLACVTYEQTHYPDTWEARLEAAQAADQDSTQTDTQANKEKCLGRYPYPGTLPPGQYVGHCGKFQRITQLPHVCVRCGVRLFTDEGRAHD